MFLGEFYAHNLCITFLVMIFAVPIAAAENPNG